MSIFVFAALDFWHLCLIPFKKSFKWYLVFLLFILVSGVNTSAAEAAQRSAGTSAGVGYCREWGCGVLCNACASSGGGVAEAELLVSALALVQTAVTARKIA